MPEKTKDTWSVSYRKRSDASIVYTLERNLSFNYWRVLCVKDRDFIIFDKRKLTKREAMKLFSGRHR